MNNEFNNQNMNQFQNSNMNSQYSNNYNNLNNLNNNKGNNGLIVVLVLIIIALVGLCLFFALDKKDNDVDTNKDNNIQENGNNNEQQDSDKVETLNCTFDGELVQGAEYVNGQYTYRYMQEYSENDNGVTEWENIFQNGWGVILTDKESTEPVTTKLCSSINQKPIVSMSYMFCEKKGTLPFGAVKDFPSQATSIDLSSFDTSNVTNMEWMFYLNSATSLDLSSFDTSNVTNMNGMFWLSQASSLDLSSFDTSNVTNMVGMFYEIPATIVYARTQEDVNRFNMSSDKPNSLTFVVK